MDHSSSLRPRRSLAFPFVVLAYPLLWLVVRTTEITAVGQPLTTNLHLVLALTTGAIGASYFGAALLVALVPVDVTAVPPWARPLVAPSYATLGVILAFSLALGAYISAASVVAFPNWFDTAASIVGFVIGWPMILGMLGVYALGNAFPALQIPFVVEFLVALCGVALSAIWVFLLASWLTALAPTTRSGDHELA